MTKQRLALTLVLSLSLLLTAILIWFPNDPKPKVKPASRLKYNVVFVSFDALGASHVGHLGYERNVTPTIDAMAKNAYTFENAYSVSSWTVPASMTWFTGVYPSEHRMVNKFATWNEQERTLANLKALSPELITLAEICKQNGAVTAGFTGNAGVSGGFGYEQGFDVYFSPKNTFGSFRESIPRALEWLKQHKDERFFLFLHGYDVHGQCTPKEGFDYRYRPQGYDNRYSGSEQEQEILREKGLDQGKLTMRKEDVRFWRAIYDEKIHRVDTRFQGFLEEFEKLGLMDNTLFVLTSDHGTEFYEHRRFDHGFTLYNELIHVPLVIKMPNQQTGKVISQNVSSIDLMPTILELLEAEIPPSAKQQFQGKSIVPVLHENADAHDVFAETNYREYTYKRAVITPDNWKLIYTLESKQRELYQLNTDPAEQNNLEKQENQRADQLQKKLFDHFKSIGHDLTQRKWRVGFNPVYPSQSKRD